MPDVLQPVEKGTTPRLGERHYSLQRLFKHPDQGAAEHKSDDLITADGCYDKAAILRDAHRHQYGAMRRHGWSWPRCLSFSWAQARARRDRLSASGEVETAMSDGSNRPSRARVLIKTR